MSAGTQVPPKPPKLVAETAIERNEADDLTFTAEQFNKIRENDPHFIRRLAGAADTDEISGRSTLLEIRSYFVVQRTFDEYEN